MGVICTFRYRPNHRIHTQPTTGPGMEVRFGGFFSAFWTVVTTAVTTGSVNASLYGMNPLVILSAFMGMLIQATPGGKGVGLMYMIMYVVITVFIVGLMSGRTPEYLGMKITATRRHARNDCLPSSPNHYSDSNSARLRNWGRKRYRGRRKLTRFHQILYEFTTAAANNGSDFLGASGNTPFFNISTGLVMFAGRFVPIGPTPSSCGIHDRQKESTPRLD